MTIVPPLDLRLLRTHVELFHRAAEPLAAAGGRLLLLSDGFDPERRQPLARLEERFAIGAVGPMVDQVLRWNRVPGRNVWLSPAIFAAEGDEVIGVIGFGIELAGDSGWLARVPLAPTAALAAGALVWCLYLLDRPEPLAAVQPVAAKIESFAYGARPGPAAADLVRGWPLAGGVYTGPSEVAAAVGFELPPQHAYRLAQLATLGEAPTDRVKIRLDATRADPGGPGMASNAGNDAGDDADDEEADADEDDIEARLARLALALHLHNRRLEIGSDVEMAQRIVRELAPVVGEVVWSEGSFWCYAGAAGCWRIIERNALRRLTHSLDGAVFHKPTGRPDAVQLSRSRIDSIVRELEALLAQRDFFAEPPPGINCASGFIRFLPDGTPELLPHAAGYRQRHTMAGRWDRWDAEAADDPPEGSLLRRLLFGCFLGDADAAAKRALLGELIGCAATGHSTRLAEPKAFVFLGDEGLNGKSASLDLMRGMLPRSAVAAVPANKFADDKFLVQLVGVTLNACDEMSTAKVVASDQFKKVTTGEPLVARDVYSSAVHFRASALQVMSANQLPIFTRGIDPALQRRLGLVMFNRVIPPAERIPGIGRRIVADEPDRLLALAVSGMERLLRQGRYTEPPSSQSELKRWFSSADPVLSWIRARVRRRDPADYLPETKDHGLPSAEVFHEFDAWAKAAGFRPGLQVSNFVQRFRAACKYVKIKHTSVGNRLCGFTIGDPPEVEVAEDEPQPGAAC